VIRLSRDRLGPREVEDAIAGLPVERLYFFAADGRQVAVFEGSESYVFFRLTEKELRQMRGGRLIHNHPPRIGFASDDPRYDALSFSPDDWRVAAQLDVAESIVVTPTWKYTLGRPAAGWLAVDDSPTDIEHMVASLGKHLAKEDAMDVRAGKTTVELAEAARSHRINERYAGEIGASYRRERR
jgi:hypothetical protein